MNTKKIEKYNKSPSANLALEIALQLDNSGSLNEAKNWCRKSIKMGSVEAIYELALLYEQEWDSKRSRKLYRKYVVKAAEAGLAKAQSRLAWSYLCGEIGEYAEREKSAAYWYEKGYEGGDESSLLELYKIYANLNGVLYNKGIAKKWLRVIESTKNQNILSSIAFEFLYGGEIKQSYRKACKYFSLAFELGNDGSGVELAKLYCAGKGTKKDLDKVDEILSIIFRGRDADSMTTMAWLHDDGEVFSQSYEEATKWYKKAAKLGDSYAQRQLGRRYREGKGIRKNIPNAIKWFQRSGENGDSSAWYSLGWTLLHSGEKYIDAARAKSSYKLAIKGGNNKGYIGIGWMYQRGTGVTISEKKSIRWFNKAVDSEESSAAHYALGWVYAHGGPTVRDYEKAAEHYRIAAEQGYDRAMTGYGHLLQNGLGVKKSVKSAAEWYQKAAGLGEKYAIANLGVLYHAGIGVEKSEELSIEYTKSASDLGCKTAQFHLGTRYGFGVGLKKDPKKARKLWKQSMIDIEASDAHFVYLYGRYHLLEESGLKKKDAISWLELAASFWHGSACYELGEIYRKGEIVEKDLGRSIEYYLEAEKLNAFEASSILGHLYANESAINRDLKKAKHHFQLAYENDMLNHRNSYAWMLCTAPLKSVRNGKQGLKIIKALIESHGEKAFCVDTLAAAYAENNRYKKAASTQKKALDLLKLEENTVGLADFEARLKAYKSNKAWRE